MSNWIETWEYLRNIVETVDFRPSGALEKQIEAARDEAVKCVADSLYEQHKEVLKIQGLKQTLSDYRINLTSNNTRNLLRKALPVIHEKGLMRDFRNRLASLKGESGSTPTNPIDAREPEKEGAQHYNHFQGREAARRYTERWLRGVCTDLGIIPDGGRRDLLFKDALRKVYGNGKEAQFWEAVKQLDSAGREDTNADLNELRSFYFSVSGVSADEVRQRLNDRFPDNEDFVPNFKRFLKEFGITQRQYKRNTWLNKVAEHLSTLRRVDQGASRERSAHREFA